MVSFSNTDGAHYDSVKKPEHRLIKKHPDGRKNSRSTVKF